ncbi:MAG: hypothetical protein ACJ72W_23655 [Actinoallomurus sp.]
MVLLALAVTEADGHRLIQRTAIIPVLRIAPQEAADTIQAPKLRPC